MSTDLDQIALDTATAIMRMYFEPIPGVQLKAKIQEVVRDAMGRAEQPSNPVARCQCCGYLVTESEHRGCLRAAEPIPVPLTDDLRDEIADKVAMFHPPKTPFDVEKNVRCARAILLLVARIVGQQTKGEAS